MGILLGSAFPVKRMRWLKNLLATTLLPALASELATLGELTGQTLGHGQWKNLASLSFASGFLIWLAIYFLLPRPFWLYVLGHELTHALLAYLHGAQVYSFRVSSHGGAITTNRTGVLIALAPYIIPLYTLLWVALWKIVDYYYSLSAYQWLLYAGMGLTWGFHFSFTLSMMKECQPDFQEHGYFFSWVLIAGANLLWALVFLALTNPAVSWGGMARSLATHLWKQYTYWGHWLVAGLGQWVGRSVSQRGSTGT
ncbi:hypothetical protein [Candidatus Methylacidithermus pantelleriae]|uniref:Uncharacterized protein n=1 Tax=Candidatus Methylacidithermus pantelleriae TaxID=2744239 RepID=A0A8J2BP27_9BACT|nr:hypothetical protein [Candidatus Methylacidithermus pantelleriae]CAF0695445.1 conserved membrane hypothetical protein [Candidatus Methylacidithermus pantelleriae]